MDEVELNKFLDEESKLTPEEEQDLLDNVENLLYEYETTEEGPQREVQPTEARAEEGVSKKAEPVAEVKKTRKVAEPIKDDTKKTELAKDYKETVAKVSKKAKENAKKDFVDRNFDNIVEKLKIQIKCPT
jgi:outer membrane biosynthesis protein TonB